MSSVHGDQTADGPSDCPHEGCWYDGELRFKRKDDLRLHRLVHGDRPQGALPVFVIAGSAAAGIDQLLLHPPQKPFGLMNQRLVIREEESESPPFFGEPRKAFAAHPYLGRPGGSPIGRPSHGGTGLSPVLRATHQKETTSVAGHMCVDWQPAMQVGGSGSPPFFEKPRRGFCGTPLQGRPPSSIACPSHGGAGLAPVLGAAHREKSEPSIWEHEHTDQQECFPASAGCPTVAIGNG